MSDVHKLDHLQVLSATAKSSQASSPDAEKLRMLAAQFESVLLGQMLHEMRSSVFDNGEETGFGSGPLADTMLSEFSLALSRAGGLGLADSVLAPLMRQATDAGSTAPPAAPGAPGLEMGVAPVPAVAAPIIDAAPAVAGRITSSYGWRRDPINGAMKFHKGTDIAMPRGQDIPVARAGRVSFAGELPGYGLTVVVDHGDRVATRYAHLSEVTAKPGDAVVEGQVIARSGASGRVTGPHLHFEVLEAGQPVDPAAWLGLHGTVNRQGGES